MFRFGLFAVAAALVSPALGESPWQPDQVNTKMCQWQQLRGGLHHRQPCLPHSDFAQPLSSGTPSTWMAETCYGNQALPTAISADPTTTVSRSAVSC